MLVSCHGCAAEGSTLKLLYQEHFHLNEAPFSIAPDPRFLYLSKQHTEALAHLQFGTDSAGGFVLLTGKVGTGKTTLCRCLIQQQGDNMSCAFILNPMVTAPELVQTICEELSINSNAKPAMESGVKPWIDALNAYLLTEHGAGRGVVVIIDEAQNLSTEALEQVRLLTNLETNKEKLLRIILLGQPELAENLRHKNQEQLAQRITARYHLNQLPATEVRHYLAHRFQVAGGGKLPFTAGAMYVLAKRCRGVPRKLNVLADRALLGAYAQTKDQVTYGIVRKAARELYGHRIGWVGGWRVARGAAMAIGIAALAWLALSNTTIDWSRLAQAFTLSPATDATAIDAKNAAATIGTAGYAADTSSGLNILLKAWHAPAGLPTHAAPCTLVARYGLACLEAQGSWQELLNINRPVLLAIPGSHDTGWLAVTVGSQNKLTIESPKGDTKTLNIQAVEHIWDGRFLLLWQLPPHYQEPTVEGAQSNLVAWLRDNLSRLGYSTRIPEQGADYFDAELGRSLRAFQHNQGLPSDGVAGPRTVIAINSVIGIAAIPGLRIISES